MNLIIDIGNTFAKIAVFEQGNLISVDSIEHSEIENIIQKKVEEIPFQNGIISNVGLKDEKYLQGLTDIFPFLILSKDTLVPFKNNYSTPKTLGIDRIGLVSAAVGFYPKENVLVIDAGTCITYDFVDKTANYYGGAISPGIDIRYKSLHNFTAKLPLLEKKDNFQLMGDSTKKSIHSGILQGVVLEIDGVINMYKQKFGHLTVVLTGGDTKFLAKQLKNSIFANQDFLLYGLYQLLIYNKLK